MQPCFVSRECSGVAREEEAYAKRRHKRIKTDEKRIIEVNSILFFSALLTDG